MRNLEDLGHTWEGARKQPCRRRPGLRSVSGVSVAHLPGSITGQVGTKLGASIKANSSVPGLAWIPVCYKGQYIGYVLSPKASLELSVWFFESPLLLKTVFQPHKASTSLQLLFTGTGTSSVYWQNDCVVIIGRFPVLVYEECGTLIKARLKDKHVCTTGSDWGVQGGVKEERLNIARSDPWAAGKPRVLARMSIFIFAGALRCCTSPGFTPI
ncbi:hypothetical protein Bbelb_209580 [Branchiostoma belcheri]|nr:hypothetical protein Bbelb_209580 [Branchiostoma belcheri]